MKKIYVGVDIGGTKTAVVLSSDPAAILMRTEFPTLPEQGPARALDLIQQEIHELLSAHQFCPSQVEAIGISCGGPLDRIHGVIRTPPNLPTWENVPIKTLLEKEFGVECRVENDANAGAAAEHRFGAGRGAQNMVFLTMGTGIGAGIITNGRLYRGASDLAGEIGHVRLTRSGPLGHNKTGSVEGWASGAGMAKVARREIASSLRRGEATSIAAYLDPSQTLTAMDIGVAMQQGDPVAKRIVNSTGRRLGEALAILVDVLNPERIVIGGLAVRLGERLLAPARKIMQREAVAASANVCEIVPAALGERIGDVAAICVAMGI
jgi:glucokinase